MLSHTGKNEHLIKEMFTNPLNTVIMDLQSYQDMIENTLDLEMITKQNKFLIKGSYNPDLQELRDSLDELEDRINRLAEKVASDLGLPEKSVKLESNSQSGYFFRVTRKVITLRINS